MREHERDWMRFSDGDNISSTVQGAELQHGMEKMGCFAYSCIFSFLCLNINMQSMACHNTIDGLVGNAVWNNRREKGALNPLHL